MEELFKAISKFLFGGISTVVVNPIRNMLAATISLFAAWSLKTTYRIAPNVGRRITQDLISVYFDQTNVWLPLIKQYVETMTGTPVEIGPLGIIDAKQASFAATKSLADGLLNKLIATIAPVGAITPDKALDNAKSFFAVNLSFQMSAWMLHWIGDTFSLGSMKSLKDLPNAISWSFGLGWLSWLVMGTPFKKAISDPLDLYYNRIYQSEHLTKSEMIDYLFRSGADSDTFVKAMEDYGLNPQNAIKLLNASYKSMTLSDAQNAYRLGIIDDATFKGYLEHQGYHPKHADIIYNLTKRQDMISIKKDIANEAIECYNKGQIDENTLKGILTDCGYDNTAQDLLFIQNKLHALQSKTLTESQILDAYHKGVLTAEQARERLRGLQYLDKDIDILFAIQQKYLSPAQILDAVTRGLITEEDAIKKLEKLGYNAEEAKLMVGLRTIPNRPGYIIDLYREHKIEYGDAVDILAKMGWGEYLAKILLGLATKQLGPDDIIKALFRGVITETEAIKKLEDLGYSEEDAKILIQTKYKILSISDLSNLFYSQVIHSQDAIPYLKAMGFRDQDIPAILENYFKPFHIWEQDPFSGIWKDTGNIWQ